MLDGSRYFAEFPDEDPARQSRLSGDVRSALAALEREISTLIGVSPDGASSDTVSQCGGAPSTSAQRGPRTA